MGKLYSNMEEILHSNPMYCTIHIMYPTSATFFHRSSPLIPVPLLGKHLFSGWRIIFRKYKYYTCYIYYTYVHTTQINP